MEFASQLAHDIIDSPLPAPLFFNGLLPTGAGKFRMSPVHVENVAQAFVNSLYNDATSGMVYRLGGEDSLTWREILSRTASATGKRKLMLPVPACGVSVAASLLDTEKESDPFNRYSFKDTPTITVFKPPLSTE